MHPVPTPELCEVVITAPDPDWLKALSRQLVSRGLAASAHNFTPVQSIYRWRGKVHQRTEGRVSLHTRRDRVAEIVAVAKREHPYEVPGISARPILDGNPDYLAWIAPETTPDQPESGPHAACGTGCTGPPGGEPTSTAPGPATTESAHQHEHLDLRLPY